MEVAMVGTDYNESPSSTGHEHEVILAELVNSTRLEDLSRLKHVAIQVESDVTTRLEKIAEGGERINFIPRVPEILREGANGAYDPQVISIGPYHWGKPWLQPTETHKRRFLADLLKRNPERGLRDYIEEIESLEPRLRSCYDKDIHMTSKNFVEMMLVDGCFLVELGLQNLEGVLNFEVNNPGQNRLLNLMKYDSVLMLENQLPFFLLQHIYDIATARENLACPSSFIQVALHFVSSANKKNISYEHVSTPITVKYQLSKTIHHCLHLYHLVYVYERRPKLEAPSSSKAISFRRRPTIPNATELHDLGIKFKINESHMPHHIKFHRGVMEISPLYMSYRTSRIMLNLIMFERFNFEDEPCFFEFLKFMKILVNTSNDVALLRTCGIFRHQFGNDGELANFFSQATKGISYNRTSDSDTILYDKVREYCYIKRHRWRASLIRDYCSSPWSTLGLVIGFILLALTFVQSYMSLHSYFRPPHS